VKHIFSFLIVSALTVSGCVYPSGPGQSTGTLLGAAAGGLAGSQIGSGHGRLVAVAVGTLAGGLIGQDIGRSLDEVDRMAMQRSTQQALESARSYEPMAWSNPDSGNTGSTLVTRTLINGNRRTCREYQQIVTIDGQKQRAYGTACRQDDGSWRVVSPSSVYTQVAAAPVYQAVPVSRPVYYDPYPRYYPYWWWPFTTFHFSYIKHSGGGHHYYGHRHGYYGKRYYGHDGKRHHGYRGGHGGHGYKEYRSGHGGKGYWRGGHDGHRQGGGYGWSSHGGGSHGGMGTRGHGGGRGHGR